MKKLNAIATRIFFRLVDGLHPGEARRIDNAKGTFMAVSIDRLSATLYAVAHRYEVNGDLVPDPDVEFFVTEDPELRGQPAVYPVAIDHGHGGYVRSVEFDGERPARVARRQQADLATFCGMWLRNIRDQQRLQATAANTSAEAP